MEIKFESADHVIWEHYGPRPASAVLPSWYVKQVEPNFENIKLNQPVNVKSCAPVEDYLTAGYILPVSYQINISEKFENFSKSLDIYTVRHDQLWPPRKYMSSQCPMKSTSSVSEYFKIQLPWKIKTPPGYSCMLFQPFYHENEDYQLMPGIIDSDIYDSFIEVAGYIKGKKEIVLMPGTPLIQIVPFRRESWKMHSEVNEKPTYSKLKHFVINGYRKLFHNKKQYV